MNDSSDRTDTILDAALGLTVERGWPAVSMAEVADRAGVPLAEAYEVVPSKPALLAALVARTDRAMLAEGAPDPDQSARDRLFEIVMRRFDALQPHKQAMAALLRDLPRDPCAFLQLMPSLAGSIAWMLEAAGLSTSGVRGMLRIKGLALIYLVTMRTWLEDDSVDMARTMAQLDRRLRRAEAVIRSVPCRPRRWSPPAEQASPVSAGPESASPAGPPPEPL